MPYKDPEKKKEYDRLYHINNREKKLACSKQWILDNKEKLVEYNKQYHLDNREKRLEYSKKHGIQYRKDNTGKVNANTAKRRAALLQRTVGWSDDLVIQMIYADCPEGHHVDHIIPLQGKNVSGLHVAWNLQYLTAEENLRKGNKYEANN